ncbi:MAG: CHAT domain-containing protein [Leadbetterella sp.]|nr:CHAT domain-containing protein [Leadbetterella sp.]
MLRILFLSGLLLAQGVFARSSPEADSLRFLGKFEKELKVRQKLQEKGFDYDLSRAHVFILQNEFAEANRLLTRLNPVTAEQHFWKSKGLALSLQEEGNPAKAILILKGTPVTHGSIHAALAELSLGQNYALMGDQLSAIRHFEQALAAFEASGYKHHYMAGLTLSDLAYAYDEAGFRNKTIEFGDRALKLFIRNYAEDFSMISTSHNNLLFYLIDYGDEKLATDVHRSYVSYMDKFLMDKPPCDDLSDVHAEGLYRLSTLRFYGFKKDYERMIQHLRLLEEFFRKAPPEWTSRNKGILSAGYELVQYCFRQGGKLDEALQYAEMVNKAEQKPYNQMKKYAALALTHYDAGNNAEALRNVDLCLAAFEFSPASKSRQTLMALKAELLSRLGKTEEARKTLDKIYRDVLGEKADVRKVDIRKYPEHINAIFINLLIHSAWTYRNIYGQAGRKEEDNRTARHFFHLAAQVFEKYYQNGVYNAQLGAMLDQIEDGLFHSPLALSNDEVVRDLNQVEAISNAHLWSRFSSKYLQNLNLPKKEIERKNNLQLQRNLLTRTYESELRHEKEIREIDIQLIAIEKKLSGISREYSGMSTSGFDIRNIQHQLKPGEVIVKYTVGEKQVYAHVISRDKITLRTLGKAADLKAETELYLSSLRNIRHPPATLQSSLQNVLMTPLETELYSSVIFISEGFLSYLPFEIFLRQSRPVSYGFSFRNLVLTRDNFRIPRTKGNLAGFVPLYSSSGAAAASRPEELRYSVQELQNIREHIGETTLYEGDEAGKAAFLKSLGKFKVHHLAMHSEMDEEDYELSSLIFARNEKLYFHELYALNFPSEMVVLSACNTGLGKYLNGEGVMSLARALTYAGVRSSVASLWQVPDKESAELMTLFYDYISDGKPKDEALMLAKRAFVEKYPMKTHPYYWAGFILTGNTTPLRMNRFPVYLVLTVVMASGLISFLVWRKRSAKLT